MPRCQRTCYRLRDGRVEPGTGAIRWVCPYCPDAETYRAIRDNDLIEYAGLARTYCISQFGAPHDPTRPEVLLYGLRPECVLDPAVRRYEIYLQDGSDALQLRLQIGHEYFHRVCSQGRIFHWTHEMLACLTSVRLLRRTGRDDYASAMERHYREAAAEMTREEMLAADLWSMASPPLSLYGRAFATGEALCAAVGWEGVRPLARCLDERGAPDVERWLRGLDAAGAAKARAVLGESSRGGVQ